MMRSGMLAMKNKFTGLRFGMPMIGAGLAGGDWDVIEEMINDIFVDEDITIVRYVPNK
jgi:hypothetical protein